MSVHFDIYALVSMTEGDDRCSVARLFVAARRSLMADLQGGGLCVLLAAVRDTATGRDSHKSILPASLSNDQVM
jgi:hypothetical protein